MTTVGRDTASLRAVHARGKEQNTGPMPKRQWNAEAHEDEAYVLVIRNVENDFAKVHQHSLPSYCCLHPERNRIGKKGAKVSQNEDGRATTNRDAECECTYTVKCRTETRSAEISVYGTRSGNVRDIFAPRRVADSHAARTERGEVTDGEESASSSATRFSSLEEMAGVMRHRPYFAYPPHIHVYASPSEPPQGAGTKRRNDGESSRATKVANDVHKAAVVKKRVSSGGVGDEDDDDEKPSPICRDSLADPLEQQTERAGEGHEKEHNTEGAVRGNVGDDTYDATVESPAPSLPLRVSQLDLATGILSLTIKLPVKELRRRISDLPGLMSCWHVSARLYRVVFVDKASLFKAKQLLDQFALDGNVRATLRVPHSMMRGHDEYATDEPVDM